MIILAARKSQMNAETVVTEHSESLRIAYEQARKELGDDPVFILHDHEGQPALVAYEHEVALSLVPDYVKAIIEEPPEPGCIWVLVHTTQEVTATQFIVKPE